MSCSTTRRVAGPLRVLALADFDQAHGLESLRGTPRERNGTCFAAWLDDEASRAPWTLLARSGELGEISSVLRGLLLSHGASGRGARAGRPSPGACYATDARSPSARVVAGTIGVLACILDGTDLDIDK